MWKELIPPYIDFDTDEVKSTIELTASTVSSIGAFVGEEDLTRVQETKGINILPKSQISNLRSWRPSVSTTRTSYIGFYDQLANLVNLQLSCSQTDRLEKVATPLRQMGVHLPNLELQVKQRREKLSCSRSIRSQQTMITSRTNNIAVGRSSCGRSEMMANFMAVHLATDLEGLSGFLDLVVPEQICKPGMVRMTAQTIAQ